MHLLTHLIFLAPAFALAAPNLAKRTGEATLQSALQSEVGSLRNRFNALCSETSSVLSSSAGDTFGSVNVSLNEADAQMSELCSQIIGVLSSVGNSAAAGEETFRNADGAARERFGDVGAAAF